MLFLFLTWIEGSHFVTHILELVQARPLRTLCLLPHCSYGCMSSIQPFTEHCMCNQRQHLRAAEPTIHCASSNACLSSPCLLPRCFTDCAFPGVANSESVSPVETLIKSEHPFGVSPCGRWKCSDQRSSCSAVALTATEISLSHNIAIQNTHYHDLFGFHAWGIAPACVLNHLGISLSFTSLSDELCRASAHFSWFPLLPIFMLALCGLVIFISTARRCLQLSRLGRVVALCNDLMHGNASLTAPFWRVNTVCLASAIPTSSLTALPMAHRWYRAIITLAIVTLVSVNPVAGQAVGTVSTLAGGNGSNLLGLVDAQGTNAMFGGPRSIAIDAMGSFALVVSYGL